MIMKKLITAIGSLLVLALPAITPGATEIPGIDSSGYIRHWVMLAPISLPDGAPAGTLLLREQIRDEASLKPKAGDRIKINNKEWTWKNVTTPTKYFDFNAILDSLNDRSAGYMATYIECDQDIPNVMMSVGSNDQGRIYFNGTDIYAFTDARPLELDGDKGKVTLKKGINVIVFKIINETNSWQGSMRLTDLSGTPLNGLKVRLTP